MKYILVLLMLALAACSAKPAPNPTTVYKNQSARLIEAKISEDISFVKQSNNCFKKVTLWTITPTAEEGNQFYIVDGESQQQMAQEEKAYQAAQNWVQSHTATGPTLDAAFKSFKKLNELDAE